MYMCYRFEWLILACANSMIFRTILFVLCMCRWYSLQGGLQALLRNIYVIIYALHDAAQKHDMVAKNLLKKITDTRNLLCLYMLTPLMDRLTEMNVRLQGRDIVLQEVDDRLQSTIKLIRNNYLHSQYAFHRPSDIPSALKETREYAEVWDPLHEVLSLTRLLDISDDGRVGLSYTVNGKHTYVPLRHKTNQGDNTARTSNAAHQDLKSMFEALKSEFKQLAQDTLHDLRKRFPKTELMKAMSMVHPSYWKRISLQDFEQDLNYIIQYFATARPATPIPERQQSVTASQAHDESSSSSDDELESSNEDDGSYDASSDDDGKQKAQKTVPGRGQKLVQPPLDADLLQGQVKTFRREALKCCAPVEVTTLQQFWGSLNSSKDNMENLSEFFKLAQIYACIPPSSCECERDFSLMNYIKDERRNRIKEKKLNICMKVKKSKYTLDNLPVGYILKIWQETKKRRKVLS